MADPMERMRALAGGLDHPEGVAWDPVAQRVYAGGEAGQVYAVGLDGAVETVAQTGGFVLGVAVDGEGLVYACDVGRGEVVRVDPTSGSVEAYGAYAGDDRMRAPNWLAFDEAGNLFVTDSGDWGAGDGRIWRIAADGRADVWCTSAPRLPNGCCLDADGRHLFVIETNGPSIARIAIADDGSAGRVEPWVQLEGIVPDGLALAADGSLLVGCYRPDAILRIDPDRRVEAVVADPFGQTLGAPANVAFVGDGLDRVVTSNLGRWHVAIGDLGIIGAPLPRPSLPRAAAAGATAR